MSKRLLILAPALSLLLAVASIVERRTTFTLRLNHGTVEFQRGTFAVYSDRVFDGMAVFQADWVDLAVTLGFAALILALICAISHRFEAALLATPNRCPLCSYNLTANTTGVCPECGTHFGCIADSRFPIAK